MTDLILKKRMGKELSPKEIAMMIAGYTSGEIPDYQMSAMLMAIFFTGMTQAETLCLTRAMAYSGDMLDLSAIEGTKVDKHSTGGVGDKTTLIVGPIVAACGVNVAKMSGRGLGHTGGTIDKLESIPGLRTDIDIDEFIEITNRLRLCIAGQSANLTPADKKIYALRDVTATTDCIPLIASSVMSKKLATGCDCILLDVKAGSGAFMKTSQEAIELANEMVAIGQNAGKPTLALVTDMSTPLGKAVGNSLEITEAIDVLDGKGPRDLVQLCYLLSAHMLLLAGVGTYDECMRMSHNAIQTGTAKIKFAQMVKALGGDENFVYDTNRFAKAGCIKAIRAKSEGYVFELDARLVGVAAMLSGAGMTRKDEKIDYTAGVVLNKKPGDYVKAGEILANIHTNDAGSLTDSEANILSAYKIQKAKPAVSNILLAKITSNETQIF